MNLVVFPKRNMRLQAGAIRIGTDNVEDMLGCLRKHRNADVRVAKPFRFEQFLYLLFVHFSILN